MGCGPDGDIGKCRNQATAFSYPVRVDVGIHDTPRAGSPAGLDRPPVGLECIEEGPEFRVVDAASSRNG